MVESLQKLNELCQKPDYKTKGNWMVRKILRPAALPITWLLLHTSISANQVTSFSIVIGLAGIALCALSGPGCFFWGMLFVQLWYLLDHVDGQIARYRGTAGLTGRFFDFMMHHVIHGTFLFAFGFYLFEQTAQSRWMLLGFSSSVSVFLFNLCYDAQYKAYFEKLIKEKHWSVRQSSAPSDNPEIEAPSMAKKIFALGHKLIEMHIMMNLFTLAAALGMFFKVPDLRGSLFIFYSLLVPGCLIVRSYYWIETRKIDRDFESEFEKNA